MNAREMFKGIEPKGKVIICLKGGYRDDFAYCICDDGSKYNIKVLSQVNPREYSVEYGSGITVQNLENAILDNEYQARILANKKENNHAANKKDQ